MTAAGTEAPPACGGIYILFCIYFIQAERAKRARLGYKKSAICHMHDACEGVEFS